MALRPPIRVTMDDIPKDWHPMAQAAAWRALRGRSFGSRAAMLLTGADVPIHMALALQRGGLGSLDPYQFTPVGRGGMNVPRKPILRNPSLVKPMSLKDAKAFSLALQQERALQQKGKHYPVRTLVENSRKRDIQATTKKVAEMRRMEAALGMHRYNPRRRGGV